MLDIRHRAHPDDMISFNPHSIPSKLPGIATLNDNSAMSFSFAQLLNTWSCVRTVTHHHTRLRRHKVIYGWLPIALAATTLASAGNNPVQTPVTDSTNLQVQCLPGNEAFLHARLNGAINAELSWSGNQLNCAGSVRPNAEGIRLRFSEVGKNGEPHLVLLFGVTGLKEGQTGKALPANLTIIREGTGEFYGTQGDNKCTMDEIRQEPLQGIPLRQRAYRVTARGFCTQPARALNGDGAILITRFDFVGRADFVSDDADTTSPP